ncbi:MAG: iron-containing alcohol dehydrogenase [Actinobacteria bacterium]|nr:iron-containing alcohol dehydrogenase [Actinomycetota bacterium]
MQVPAQALFGAGVRSQVGEQIRRLGGTRALLVTDRFMLSSGPAEEIKGLIEAAGVACAVFADVQPDPTDVNVATGLEALRAAAADVVVAFGGGSVLDAAKMMTILAANEGPLREFRGYHRIPAAGIPLIAVPTTAGTGSEATRVAVITDTERDEKLMILDGHLVPAVAIVDFELSATMPPSLTAFVGVDTLTHGIEAYVSALANPLTDALALACVRLVGEFLERAWRDPGDMEARAGMAMAAYAGGAAFANASVGLVHGMSRPIGAVFHVPHGLSNAVLLPTVTRFSLPGASGRYAQLARLLGFAAEGEDDATAAARMVAGLEDLNRRLEVPRLGALEQLEEGAFEASVAKMAADALASGSPDRNPVVPTAEEIVVLYKEAW